MNRKYNNISKNSLDNLIPLNTRTKTEQRKIATMGGLANKDNPNSKLAAKLREMKKKGLSNENLQFLYEMMTDSELSSLKILEFILSSIRVSTKPSELNGLIKILIEWYKLKHGTKENNRKIEIKPICLTSEEKEKAIRRLCEKE